MSSLEINLNAWRWRAETMVREHMPADMKYTSVFEEHSYLENLTGFAVSHFFDMQSGYIVAPDDVLEDPTIELTADEYALYKKSHVELGNAVGQNVQVCPNGRVTIRDPHMLISFVQDTPFGRFEHGHRVNGRDHVYRHIFRTRNDERYRRAFEHVMKATIDGSIQDVWPSHVPRAHTPTPQSLASFAELGGQMTGGERAGLAARYAGVVRSQPMDDLFQTLGVIETIRLTDFTVG